MLRASSSTSSGGGGGGMVIGDAITGATAGSVLFAGVGGALAQDNTNFFWDDTNNWLGIGTNTPDVPLHVGPGTVNTPDAIIASAMLFTGTGNAHCFNDSNNFNITGLTGSYNSYDARPTIQGIGTSGAHYAAFQIRPTFSFSTTLSEARGYHFTSSTELTGGGTITDMYAFLANHPTCTSGTVTNYYAFYASPPAAGVTNSYGIYVAGTPTNFLGGKLGIGIATPTSKLHIAGSVSQAAWTTSGVAFNSASATYTDTSSSGMVSAVYINTFLNPTIAADAATTYTSAVNTYIGNAPAQGTNVTITTGYSLVVAQRSQFRGFVGIGGATTIPTSVLQIGTNQSSTSWTTQGLLCHIGGQTLTDTSGSGTIATRVGTSIFGCTFASSSAVTVTNGATLYISNAAQDGTNTTITNPWALWVDAGNVRLDGSVAIGVATTPTARLHLGAGAAGAGTAPLKLTSGTNNTTAEAGAFEYNGTNLFFTRSGTTRENVICASAVTTEVIVSDTSLTINYNGTTYKILAMA